MKKAVFNIVYDLLPCYKFCHESVERYAKKVGADLIWRQKPTNQRKVSPVDHLNYQILAERESLCDLLKIYDKVLAVDGDVLIKDDAPDIFESFPVGTTYILDETGNFNDNNNYDTQIERIRGAIDWPKKNGHYMFFNCGIILADKQQAELFRVVPEEYVYFPDLNLISCEPYITSRIFRHGFRVRDIGKEWNAMVYFKQDGHFIHFANISDRDERIREYA